MDVEDTDMSKVAVKYCPYEDATCSIESEYDILPMTPDAITAITENMEDEEEIAGALAAASGKVFRGTVCRTCGAWFPAE